MPYSDSDANCFDAALAAFPASSVAAELTAWWRDTPADTRARIARGEVQLDLDAVAWRFGAKPSEAPTGREIGYVKQIECAPPIFIVGAAGAWFCRGKRRAVRLPRNVPVARAWSVT